MPAVQVHDRPQRGVVGGSIEIECIGAVEKSHKGGVGSELYHTGVVRVAVAPCQEATSAVEGHCRDCHRHVVARIVAAAGNITRLQGERGNVEPVRTEHAVANGPYRSAAYHIPHDPFIGGDGNGDVVLRAERDGVINIQGVPESRCHRIFALGVGLVVAILHGYRMPRRIRRKIHHRRQLLMASHHAFTEVDTYLTDAVIHAGAVVKLQRIAAGGGNKYRREVRVAIYRHPAWIPAHPVAPAVETITIVFRSIKVGIGATAIVTAATHRPARCRRQADGVLCRVICSVVRGNADDDFLPIAVVVLSVATGTAAHGRQCIAVKPAVAIATPAPVNMQAVAVVVAVADKRVATITASSRVKYRALRVNLVFDKRQPLLLAVSTARKAAHIVRIPEIPLQRILGTHIIIAIRNAGGPTACYHGI